MAAFVNQSRIQAETLIWHPEAPQWLEVHRMAPSWWTAPAPLSRRGVPNSAVASNGLVHQVTTSITRSFAPMAPSRDKASSAKAKVGFFSSLFGIRRK